MTPICPGCDLPLTVAFSIWYCWQCEVGYWEVDDLHEALIGKDPPPKTTEEEKFVWRWEGKTFETKEDLIRALKLRSFL